MEALLNAYLTALAQCAAEQVNDITPTCFSGITVGDSYISTSGIGDCEEACGEMWVRVIQMYPSTTVGVADQRLANCSTGIGLDIEIGALRCIQINEDGETWTAEQLADASTAAMNDAIAIYRAMVCCDHFPDVIVGSWTPLGPEGGLVGGLWTLSVGM